MNGDSDQDSTGRSFGLLLMACGGLTIFFSNKISGTGLGSNHDPGPRAFPMGLGICLVAGGLWEFGRWLLKRSRDGSAVERRSWSGNLKAVLIDPTNRDAFILIGALCLYIPAIPWLGFGSSTFLFGAAMMARLGARWWVAVLVSVGLVAVIYLLFVLLFRVQLPAGILGSPF